VATSHSDALVLFGVTGDLAHKMIFPALYAMAKRGALAVPVIGVALPKWSQERLHKRVTDSIEHSGGIVNKRALQHLLSVLTYVSGDYEDHETFTAIKSKLGKARRPAHYLAIPPSLFETVIKNLGTSGLAKNARVIVEKPFGRDLASARELNQVAQSVFPEDSIFRIDHFLGKETVQNIMVLRFANFMFEPIWNRDHIDHVQITAAETVGVESRGGFYDKTGALRDMVPNHMFQLLAMMTMEAPNSFDADAVRAEKAKVIEAIRRVSPEEAIKNAVRGQYVFGEVKGKPMQAYRQSPDVDHKSRTETYIALKLWIDNWRWADVPFYIRTGKAMTARKTEIAIQFKKAPGVLFRDIDDGQLSASRMIFRIQPDEGIQMRFSAKEPGRKVRLSDVNMNFRYSDYFKSSPSTGYETLIYDCLIGDATLFQRADNVETGWAVVQPLLDAWAGGHDAVHWYEAGSAGPKEADDLLAADGRKWLSL
jgi:glucose-6-phosphate 1-dehydrogenase